jgi:hypothetical protein
MTEAKPYFLLPILQPDATHNKSPATMKQNAVGKFLKSSRFNCRYQFSPLFYAAAVHYSVQIAHRRVTFPFSNLLMKRTQHGQRLVWAKRGKAVVNLNVCNAQEQVRLKALLKRSSESNDC